ncbi:MAG: hypothetical protein M5U23_09565 [Acidimicrobiia bacterium]|nr:hypothetical protein [Acidimicrobiia bacterium]
MRHRPTRHLLAIALAALVGVSVLAIAVLSVAASPSSSKAWIDQPLTGSVFTHPTVDVIAHAADPVGVKAMSLTVSGQVVEVMDLAEEKLQTATFAWTAPSSGVYVLEVAGQNTEGVWGASSAVQITIDLGDSTTTTTAVEATTTVPSTTTTSCNLGVPTPTDITDTSTLTPTLHWTYDGCQIPESFDVELSKIPGFERLEWSDQAPGTERELQVTIGEFCTTYYWRVRTSASDTATAGPWSSVADFVIAPNRCP